MPIIINRDDFSVESLGFCYLRSRFRILTIRKISSQDHMNYLIIYPSTPCPTNYTYLQKCLYVEEGKASSSSNGIITMATTMMISISSTTTGINWVIFWRWTVMNMLAGWKYTFIGGVRINRGWGSDLYICIIILIIVITLIYFSMCVLGWFMCGWGGGG